VAARGGEWSCDGRSIAYEGDGIWRFDVRSGRSTRLARFGAAPNWSSRGRMLAFTGGGRFGDRTGTYRVAASGGRSIRLRNDCVVQGSSGPDRLEGGEFSHILVGGGGDDVLTAFDDFYYEGDRLEGGAGQDRLTDRLEPMCSSAVRAGAPARRTNS
jgi:Ca2+-binding RTX toxin-like protein